LLSQRARVLPYKEPAEFQRIVDGLAKAGLPTEVSAPWPAPPGKRPPDFKKAPQFLAP
jgi:hypothetical protein